ncbi:DNA-directed RNA polymerase I subunit RPA2 [Nephila pilipes]|uniref:DNA-directed RNA polymerase subunit beta n=1 Tax=Nephila pilipes TaxID=299642 RepID=A0A8X6T3E9_NEPPI|nr:DNA-directed RNA polymerase I subunit RPA2 [Nephila pilipes]
MGPMQMDDLPVINEKKCSYLKEAARIHIDSFNYVIDEGLRLALLDIDPVFTKTDPCIKISISDAELNQLQLPMDLRHHKRTIYPTETRIRKTTYYAELYIQLKFETKTETEYSERVFFVPLMLKSNLCLLNGMDDENLLKHKEDLNDPGGYFIVEGEERVLRTFILPRRNYPLALINDKWKSLGDGYSEYGVLISCVKENHTFSDVSLHYVNNTKSSPHVSVEVRIFYQGKSYFIPVMLLLKSLVNECDYHIIKEILKFSKENASLKICLINMLHDLQKTAADSVNHHQVKNLIGKLFHPVFIGTSAVSYTDVTDNLLKSSVFIHLNNNDDKFKLFCFCICKLFALVKNDCKNDDLDNPVFQEVLLPGQTYLLAVKEGARTFLNSVKNSLSKRIKENVTSFKNMINLSTNRAISLTPIVKHMISTGNMPGKYHGLISSTGYTITLKRMNVFEVASQFNGISRFSMKFYSRNMRKFYPESWGFFCPVQTPEGEKIGLYNHLASQCQIVNLLTNSIQTSVLYQFGVLDFYDPLTYTSVKKCPVYIDGEILGWITQKYIQNFLLKLKLLRSKDQSIIPKHTEIVHICEEEPQILFPGLYIFSTPCRFVRHVKNCNNQVNELLGCFEQLSLHITLFDRDDSEISGYSEIKEYSFLGMAASTIPFGENNPATRNIFTTGKSKQAVGFGLANAAYRADTKSMFLTYPQNPLVFTSAYACYNWDENPTGTNVCIAVMSYSGFDMEDAIVINKSSVNRGLMRDVMYQTETYSFEDLATDLECKVSELIFKSDPCDPFISDYLDSQGMPYVGCIVTKGCPVLSVFSQKNNKCVKTYEKKRPAHIDSVRFMGVSASSGNKNLPSQCNKVSITYRIMRIPEIGDKFSNRHGQKGICGLIIPSEDLPFAADGFVPDILFNPHSLPSRLTVGMLLEILASKSGIQNSTRIVVKPFEFSDKKNAAMHFGKILKDAGLDFYGTQKFYSGTSGEELEADIFCGSVYYFRLCHIVEEKFQVSSVAKNVDPATMQPININKTGAVRFGEMERDAILSHGAMNLTQDRLLYNSDICKAFICLECKILLFPVTQPPHSPHRNISLNNKCQVCKRESNFGVHIPYVLVYMVTELAAMGIKVKFSEK